MNIKITSNKVADGFNATYYSGNKGDVYRFHTDELILRSECAWRQRFIRGSVKMIEKPDGAGDWPVLIAGDCDQHLPDLVPGDYCYEAQEDDTFWVSLCALSGGYPAPFQHIDLSLKNGEVFTLKQGSILVLGSGSLVSGEKVVTGPIAVFAKSKDVAFEAQGHVIAVAGWR